MVSARDFKELALVPLRGTVYVFSIPFVLVVRFLSMLYMLFISTPVSYAKRFVRRVQVTWEWTRGSAKSLLPWNYYSSSANTARRAIESGHGTDDYLASAEELLEQRRPSSRSARRQRKRTIISSLIKALLEPASPTDSDDEVERSTDEDRLYQLVRELINISRQETGPLRISRAENLPVLDLEALKNHGRDKEKLLAFITELDEYVAGMESEEAPNGGGNRRTCATAGEISSDLRCQPGEEVAQDLFASPVPSTEGYGEVDSDEEERFSDARLDLPYSQSVNCRGLSPLIEVSPNPELASAESTESLRNCADLETELNVALSHLNDMTNELEYEAVVAARQTNVTETVTLVSDQRAPETRAPTGKADSSFEDASDGFSCIPKIHPTLGIEAGHNKRDLASARKPRPPSLLKKSQHETMIDSDSESEGSHRSEYSSDEEEEGDVDAQIHRVEGLPHSLSDQLRLLSPSSLQPHVPPHTAAGHQEQEEQPSASATDLYSSVNKEARQSRSHSEGCDAQQFPSGTIHKVRSSSLEDARTSESESSGRAPELSLFIRDRVPPWKQIRSRSNSNTETTGSQPSTPTQAPAHPHPTLHTTASSHTEATPPPIPPRTSASHPPTSQSQSRIKHTQESKSIEATNEDHCVYDKLPRMQMMPPIPSQAGQEGVYDLIPYHQQQQQQQQQLAQCTQYLHERIEKKSELQSRPPVSWTPDLPPRNMRMRRTASADVMDELSEDQDYPRLRRSGSERRSTSSVDEYHHDHSRRHRSLSGEREQSSSSEYRHQHHHHHRGEHSGVSRQRSASEKQRSSSGKHSSSSASSKPVELGMGSFLKILVSPSSSKNKTQSRKKDVEKRKEEVKPSKEASKKRKQSSSKSRSSDEDKESAVIPRNESGTSLRSGVSMHSTESSSSGQDCFD